MQGGVLAKIVLTRTGDPTYTYGVDTDNPIVTLVENEEDTLTQTVEVTIHNGDQALTDIDLKGYQGVVSTGYNTSAGDEYSPCAPMKVIAQRFDSYIGGYGLTCTLSLAGTGNQMGEDHASDDYSPEPDSTDIVKDIITAICDTTYGLGGSRPYSHCASITVTYDSEDSLIGSLAPKDYFKVGYGETRKAKILWLLGLTECVGRFEDDGELHIRKIVSGNATDWVKDTAYTVNDTVKPTTDNTHIYTCTTAGTSDSSEPTWGTTIGGTTNDNTVVWTLDYDYQYTLVAGDHNFYSKAHRRRLVIPNSITVESSPDHATQYTGTATDADSITAIGTFKDFFRLRLTSNAEASSIAQARISKLQIASERGSAEVPMNVGQEVFDLVKFTDVREGDYRIGNILSLTRRYEPEKFRMTVRLGSVNVPAPMGIAPPPQSSDDSSQSDITTLYDMVWELQQAVSVLASNQVILFDAVNRVKFPYRHIYETLIIPTFS